MAPKEIWITLILTALTATLVAEPIPQPEKKTSSTKVETVEVLVDVIVTDNRGRPIIDLRPEEFTILENGSPQAIRSIWLEVQPDTGKATVPAAPSPAEGITVNRRPAPNLVILLFDNLSLSPQSRLLAVRSAREVIQQWPAESPLAVFLMDRRLALLQPFESDRKSLLKALEQVPEGRSKPYASSSAELERLLQAGSQQPGEALAEARRVASSPASAGVDPGAINALLLDSLRQFESYDREMQAQRTVLGLLALIRSLQPLPGRKTVILFSEGFSVPESVHRQYQSVIGSANRSNVAVYTIDSAGLRLDKEGEAASRELTALGSARNRGSDPSLVQDGRSALGRAEELGRMDQTGILRELADSTGGLAMRNSNDLRGAFQRVRNDLNSYYLLSYRPADNRMDGSFRKIQVKVSRPEVSIRARSGYDAVPFGNVGPQLEYERHLWQALLQQPAPQDIPLELFQWRFPASLQTDWLLLTANLPASSVQFSPAAAPPDEKKTKNRTSQRYLGARVDFMAVIQDPQGQVLGKKSQSFDLLVAESQLPKVRQATITFQRSLIIPAKVSEALLAGQDQGNGRTTVLHQSTPAPEEAGDSLRLSSIVPIRTAQPAGPGDSTDDPLFLNGSQLVPNANGRFSKATDGQMRFFFIVLATPGSAAKAQVEFLQKGQILAQAPGDLPAADARGFIRFLSEFPLEPFSPGDYTLRVTVEENGKRVNRSCPFAILP